MSGDDPSEDEFSEADDVYRTYRNALTKILQAFTEEHDLDPGMLAELLLDLGISYQSVDYFNRVERPSAGGLRLEFDRLGRQFHDLLRLAKKEADSRVKLLYIILDEAESQRASADDDDQAG